MNNAAFLSLEKGIFKSWRKASLDMYAPLSLQHWRVRHILFQVQRQKIVFADYLLFSLVAAAGCLGPADKLQGLMASPSKHSFSFLPLRWGPVLSMLPCWSGEGERAEVALCRGQQVPHTAPLTMLSMRRCHSFCCRGLLFKEQYIKNLPWVGWCAFAAVFSVKERSSSQNYTCFSFFVNTAVWNRQGN